MSGSGAFRQRLPGLTKGYETRTIEANNYQKNNGNYNPPRRAEGVQLLNRLKDQRNKFEKLDSDWTAYLNSITDPDEKTVEDKRYTKVASNTEDVTKLSYFEMIDNLDLAITDITSELELLSMYVPIPNVTAPTFPTPVTVAPPQVTVNFVPPAENKRRLFSGNPADYKSFIDEHDASVGSQTMANVLKLQKLKERCDGEAYDAIKRFNTDAGYQEALAKLKQRFGSDAQAIAALRKQLYVPVKDKTDLLAVRKSFDDFECCLSKLDEYNQDIDSIEFKLALLRKLPDIIISKLSDFEISLKREATVAEYCEHADLQISAHQKNFGNKFQQGFQKSNKKVEVSKAVANTTRDPKVKRHQDPNLGDKKPQQHQQARVKYPPKCSFCEGQHRNDNCPVVTTVEEAKLIASDKRLCFTCFRSNHRTPDCRKEIECTHCHKPHHTLYCHSLRPDLRHNSRKDSKGSSPVVAAYKAVSSESDTEVLLFTREVLVSHPGNPSLAQKVLVFVDNGAQIPLIDYTLSASLKLPCANVSTTCQGADGNQFVASGKYKLNIHLEDGTTLPVYPYGAANLVQRISVPKVPVEKYLRATKGKFPLPIKLGLPLLLLSMREYALLFIDEDSKKLDNGFVLWQSKLGPFISGEGKVQRECIRSQSPLVSSITVENNLESNDTQINLSSGNLRDINAIETEQDKGSFSTQKVDDSLSYNPALTLNDNKPLPAVVAKVSAEQMLSDPTFLYELEVLGINDDPNADECRLFKQRFLETVEQREDGRIFAELPFLDMTGLGTNLNNCYKRLAAQSKKFLRDPAYGDLYKSCVDEFLKNKFTEVIPTQVIDDADGHFLPHSLVLTPGKTTEARFVIDGSCPTEKGASINDKLLTGENRLPSLAGILIRARLYRIIVASDIRKAFLQIHLLEQSKKYVRFLFLKDIRQPISRENLLVCQFLVIPFGLGPSQNMLGHAIAYHLKKYAETHEEIKKYLDQIKKNNYVDNSLMGSDNVAEAIASNELVKEAFAAGKMDLRGHASNNAEVNRHFGFVDKSFNLLGHELFLETDEFVVGWKKLEMDKPPRTKRALLAFSASLFDLLGLLEPVRLPVKCLIRKVWDQKLDWKSVMDKKLIDEARELYDERVNFQVRFKRPVFTEFPSSGVQLHIFADASGYAYGCVAYLRYLTRDGKYRTSLIFSKSRLAPLKPIMSITKLELTATALAGHVAQFLKDELQSVVKIDRTFIHTDSTTVLYWLKNPLNKGRYVINRVKKLIATDAEFRHIAGVENPADVVSRGCSPAEFLAHKSWFVGPAFLCQSEEFWPRQPNSEELKVEPQVIAHVNACTQIYIEALPPMVNAKRMRTWTSLVNATSKALEFVFKISKGFPLVQKRIFGTSVLDEFLLMKMSEKLLLIQIQHSNEVLAEKIHALDLYCDKGIWRKYNRIENEADPIYLVDCAASQLLILQLHEATNHGSVSMVLGQLNKSYFLPKARSLLKSIIRKRCMRCRRLKALPFALPLMKDLPNVRTHGKPFESIGVDLCGPFKVKLHQEVLSAWIVVYTCLVSRAVHLELVTSLSGEAFIDSLTRFASRRGMPSFIYSDNGTNLKVASLTVIPQWITKDDPNVMDFCTSKKIRWKFVTEKTPWAGGVYEAMVKLVKRNLKIAIGKKQVNFFKMLTLLCQIEAFVNCRPLTYVSDDSHQVILRPIDFISPFIKPGLPPIDVDIDDPDFCTGSNHDNLVVLWKELQARLNKFKELFVNDYLAMIRDRCRHHNQSGTVLPRSPRLGEVVTIYEENYDPIYWKLGKVIQVTRSQDDRCRTAKVVTANGNVLNRPINHLYSLEVDDESMKDLTSAVKATVVKTLVDRFGNRHAIISELQLRLRTMKRATPDPSSIRYAVDSIHNICRQLENQGCCIDNEPMKLDIMDRMPDEMQKKLYWFNQSTNATTNEVLKKMEKLALKAETVPPSIASSQPTLSKSIEVNNVTKIESTTWKATSQSCRLCDGQHRPSRCPTYSTPQAKIRQLNNKKWCVKCMSKDHIANNCPRTNIKCSKCNGSHLFFLCTKSIAEDNSKAMMSINRSQSAMLAKKVLVSHPSNGHEAEVTVFFDSGSQRSYVSKNLMKKLDLPIVNTETITVTGFGGKVSCCKSDLALMKLKTDDGWQELYANSVEKIVDRIPVIEKKKDDTFLRSCVNPDILIGLDYYYDYIRDSKKISNDIRRIDSKIGEMFCGSIPMKEDTIISSIVINNAPETNDACELFWKLEAMGINDRSIATIEDEAALKQFEESIKFKNNRYYISWPNRLKEVLECKAECLFVPGKFNPADLGTRGISIDELKSCSQWINGPDFLCKDRDDWPKPPEYATDLTQTMIALVSIADESSTTCSPTVPVDRAHNIDTTVSWKTLILQTAKKMKKNGIKVDPMDVQVAENAIICQEQEILIKPNDIKEFKLIKDDKGVYRINCRFDHAELINAHPIFIPKTSSIAKMIVMEIHEELQHAGIPHTLSMLRETYWIPAGRALVKKCINRCSECKIWKSKPFELPIMPQLPGSRVCRSKPFQSTGVDYCGPFKIKGSNEKAWVILFTCFTTRLVHLEVVETMNAEDFLLSFRNFVGRCGKPKYILSDNAKQFKTAAKALDEIWKKAVLDDRSLDYFLQNDITWDFITERAPWKGGLYERMVGLVKNAMKMSIGKKVLTVYNFRTLLIEIEATINSRPLTYVHAKEPFVIRPADFIYPSINLQLPSIANENAASDRSYIPNTAGGGVKLVELYEKNLQCLDKFWQIWSKDYLNMLRERNGNEHKSMRGSVQRKPIAGEIVLVYESDQPRNNWKTAKINDVIESSDAQIRSCEIQYMDGFITRRALNHLYPLEEGAVNVDLQAEDEEVDSYVE